MICLGDRARILIGCEYDDGNVPDFRGVLDVLQQAESIQIGVVHVENDEIRAVATAFEQAERALPVWSDASLVEESRTMDRVLRDLRLDEVIIDEQDLRRGLR